MKDPVCVLFAYINVDHRARKKPENTRLDTIDLAQIEIGHFPFVAVDGSYLLIEWLLVRHDG